MRGFRSEEGASQRYQGHEVKGEPRVSPQVNCKRATHFKSASLLDSLHLLRRSHDEKREGQQTFTAAHLDRVSLVELAGAQFERQGVLQLAPGEAREISVDNDRDSR